MKENLNLHNKLLVQTVDYYPYGSKRVTSGSYTSSRQFIGEHYDPSSNLNYLNARYYDPVRGQFFSQDPVFWGNQNLLNPQSLNSYSYAENNLVNKKDPSGLQATTLKSVISGLKKLVNNLKEFVTNLRNPQVSQVSKGTVTTQPSPLTPPQQSGSNQRTSTWDPITDQRISTLDQRVQQPATNFINNTESQTGVQLRVNEGRRSNERQEELYAQGRTKPGNIVTNARAGESPHNQGLAIDVVIVESGKENWRKPITNDIANIGMEQGFTWGGNWSTFQDYPHFEMNIGQ